MKDSTIIVITAIVAIAFVGCIAMLTITLRAPATTNSSYSSVTCQPSNSSPNFAGWVLLTFIMGVVIGILIVIGALALEDY